MFFLIFIFNNYNGGYQDSLVNFTGCYEKGYRQCVTHGKILFGVEYTCQEEIQMGKLHIQLLGTPTILSGNTPLHIQRKAIRLLLYYLACQNEPVSRSELSLLFWETGSEELIRRRLREILSKLRSELPDPSILVVYHDQVSLDQSKIFVDYIEYQKLFVQSQEVASRIHADSPLPLQVYQKMVQAVDLWRGPRFLTGVNIPDSEGLDRWLLNTSEQMESSREFMVDRLADHSTASGDLEGAIRWLRMALSMDEINESAHYRLIKCLTNLGRHNQAAAHCSYINKIFQQEGIMELPPPLIEICKQVQDLSTQSESTEQPVWHSKPVIQSPFVGQKQLLIELKQYYQRGGTVVIFGEAGSGKTRLVYEFQQDLSPSPRTLVAQGRPLENRLPFQPLTDMLRRSIHNEEWKTLDQIWVSHFLRLMPELSISHPEIKFPYQASSEETRTFLFQAIWELLSILAKSRRIVLYLEDAQWADEATLAALAYLVERKFFRDHGLLILAARPEDMNPLLENFINRTRTAEGGLGSIRIEQMSTQETGELAQYILGEVIPEDLALRLVKETGGNPFFLVETLRALMELSGGTDLNKIQNRFPLAGSIQSLVKARLQLLDPRARQLITTAAVIGEEFSVTLLEAASDQSPEKIAETLDDMEKNRFIQRISESVGGTEFLFPHSKMREAILLELSPARKRILHLKVAHAMEEIYRQTQTKNGALAQHYESAGEIHKAFHYWQAAGIYAKQMLSKIQTFDAFNNVEMILKKSSSEFTAHEIHDFYSSWCEIVADDFEDIEVLQRIATTMLRLGEQKHSPLLVGAGLNWQAVAEMLRENATRGLFLADQANPFIQQSNDLYEGIINRNVTGFLLLLINMGTKASDILEESIMLGEDSTDPRVQRALINAQNQLALTYNLRGHPEKALIHARKSLKISEVLFLPQKVLFSLTNISLAQFYLGKFGKCIELCTDAIRKAEEETPIWRWAAFNYLILSRAELNIGMLDESYIHNQKAIKLNENHRLPDFLAESFCLQGIAMRLLNNPVRGIGYLRKGIETSGGKNFQALECLFYLGDLLVQNGNRIEGNKILNNVINQARKADLATIYLLARAGVILQNVKEAGVFESLGLIDDILAEARERNLGWIEAICCNYAGETALIGGETKMAGSYAGAAINLAREIQSPWIEIQAIRLLLKSQKDETGSAYFPEHSLRIQHLVGYIRDHSRNQEFNEYAEKMEKEVLLEIS